MLFRSLAFMMNKQEQKNVLCPATLHAHGVIYLSLNFHQLQILLPELGNSQNTKHKKSKSHNNGRTGLIPHSIVGLVNPCTLRCVLWVGGESPRSCGAYMHQKMLPELGKSENRKIETSRNRSVLRVVVLKRWFDDYMVTVMLSCVYIITGKEPCTGRSIFR